MPGRELVHDAPSVRRPSRPGEQLGRRAVERRAEAEALLELSVICASVHSPSLEHDALLEPGRVREREPLVEQRALVGEPRGSPGREDPQDLVARRAEPIVRISSARTQFAARPAPQDDGAVRDPLDPEPLEVREPAVDHSPSAAGSLGDVAVPVAPCA